MNTTVTVETVHGLKDTFVVGSNGVVGIAETFRADQLKAQGGNGAGTVSSESVDVRESGK